MPLRLPAAQDSISLLREAQAATRTNLQVSLALCDRAVAAAPTNAQPLVFRARVLDRLYRYEDAINDLGAAIKLQPQSAELWQGRGEVYFKAGHFHESVVDFDRVIALSPAQAPHHWQRGISLYYDGRFADGRKQFESHQTVNPSDVENATWHFLCIAKESGITNARARMLSVGMDGRVPMKEIYALYRGTGTVEQVLSAARAASPARQRDALFYAYLYLGLYFDALGEDAKARAHIEKAAKEFGGADYMGDVARVQWRKTNSRK